MPNELDTRSVQELIHAAFIENDEHTVSEIILTLQSRGTLEVFDAAYEFCVDQDPRKRLLGFRIFEDLGTLELAFPNETRDLAVHLAEREPDTKVLMMIARVLARVGGTSAIQTLEKLQQSAEKEIRYGVVFAITYRLSKNNRTSAIPIVLRSLLDADNEVRYEAAAFLAEHFDLHSEEIQSALMKAVKDSNPGVRGQALLALVRRNDPSAFECLLNELKTDRFSVAALDAAGESGDSRLYPLLQEISKWWDADSEALKAAMEKCKPGLV